jgi:hypothetical protein
VTAQAVEDALEAAVPEYTAWLRSGAEWSWERDEQATVFLLLEHLRLWLLERADGDGRARAWAAVETLLPTSDDLLVNALAVGLLEGHWPRRDVRAMGPRTRALWEEEP